jgi:hypothetical protein
VREFDVQVPIIPRPAPPERLVRVSAHIYNELPQYEKLAAALRQLTDHSAAAGSIHTTSQ